MDIATITSLASSFSALRTTDQGDVAVLKKALDVQAQASLALISALPPAQSLPSSLGNHIDTVA